MAKLRRFIDDQGPVNPGRVSFEDLWDEAEPFVAPANWNARGFTGDPGPVDPKAAYQDLGKMTSAAGPQGRSAPAIPRPGVTTAPARAFNPGVQVDEKGNLYGRMKDGTLVKLRMGTPRMKRPSSLEVGPPSAVLRRR